MGLLYYKYFAKKYTGRIPLSFDLDHVLKDRHVLSSEQINRELYNRILSGEPLFAGRLGGMEFSAIHDYLLSRHFIGIPYIRSIQVEHLCKNAGFFPGTQRQICRFSRLMLESLREIDVQLIHWGGFENYLIEEYVPKTASLTKLLDAEPWQEEITVPWSAALEGKKILAIHPFEDTIRSQYEKREHLFPGTNILPAFELKTLKAVQTIAGQKDDRFETWFDALEYMYQEALKIDFDVAIIGCGAYGFPLAAKLKKAGKQAIHLGGATQLLFGIKGARWEQPIFQYVNRWFNDSWVYPMESERPQNAQSVEGACYWGK